MALSKDEREQFLAEPHIAALSVSAGDKRGPLTVPIWYQYSPGGEPWVITGAGSRKHRLIETQGEFTLMAQPLEATVRYVAVDGTVSRIEPGTDEQTGRADEALSPGRQGGRVPRVRPPRTR
jgi:nitroimidazol reductase NimA-like FMN-containing flavoprotein (pyridoxamine 5'-phosphate oxidase superfamily)